MLAFRFCFVLLGFFVFLFVGWLVGWFGFSRTAYFPDWLYHFILHSNDKDLLCFTLVSLWICHWLICLFDSFWWVCSDNFYFSKANNAKHIFMCLFDICILSVQCFSVLCKVDNWIFLDCGFVSYRVCTCLAVLLLLKFCSFLYILDTSSL